MYYCIIIILLPTTKPIYLGKFQSAWEQKMRKSNTRVIPTHLNAARRAIPTHLDAARRAIPTHLDAATRAIPIHLEAARRAIPTHLDAERRAIPTHFEAPRMPNERKQGNGGGIQVRKGECRRE